MMDWQLVVVLVIVVPSALYVARTFLRQFFRSEDEAGACSGCPANRPATPRAVRETSSRKSEAEEADGQPHGDRSAGQSPSAGFRDGS